MSSISRPLTVMVSFVLLAFAAIGLSRTGAVQPFRSLADRVFSPLDGAVHAVTAPLADFVTNAGSYGDLRSENQRLRDDNERLSTQINQLREAQAQTQQLNDLSQSAQLFPDADFVLGNVIARDPSNVHDAVLIDHGSNDGIQPGMIVMGKEGALIGTVSKVQATSAWVRLITDPDSDVNAEVQETRAMAVVSGQLGHRLQLEFVAAGTDVKAGDTVVTSGLGGNFPKALLIGRVSSVEGAPSDLFKRIQVDPAIRPGTLESVLVMTSFVPSRTGTGP
jgi:rod shape-determining protein MreC